MEEENETSHILLQLFIWLSLLITHCNTEQGNTTCRVPYYRVSSRHFTITSKRRPKDK